MGTLDNNDKKQQDADKKAGDDGCKSFNRRHKVKLIQKAMEADPVDTRQLKNLAIMWGGLLNDDIRQQAWPKLLGVDVDNIAPKPEKEILYGHRDYNQVVLDVQRTLKRFPPGMEEQHRLSLQDKLVDLIMRVLVRHPELHYYQGYHDICVTFLLVTGEDIAFALMEWLSVNHLRDFMDSTMDRTKHILNYLYPIVGMSKPHLRDFMEESEVGSVFSLSWLITWYGHVLDDLRHIVRLYDFFIACHPLMPIYLAAVIVLYREKEILSSECDMCVLHGLLSKIPPNLPFELLIREAGDLFIQYPPTQLANEAINTYKRKALVVTGKKSIQRYASQRGFGDSWLWRYLVPDGGRTYFKVTAFVVVALLSSAAWNMWIARDW